MRNVSDANPTFPSWWNFPILSFVFYSSLTDNISNNSNICNISIISNIRNIRNISNISNNSNNSSISNISDISNISNICNISNISNICKISNISNKLGLSWTKLSSSWNWALLQLICIKLMNKKVSLYYAI